MSNLELDHRGENDPMLRAIQALEGFEADPRKRGEKLKAVFCRVVRPIEPTQVVTPLIEVNPPEQMAPRMRETLGRLLRGESEKQIATGMGRSRHTVHVYVKAIYRRFGVCSRAELLAQWVKI